ncbi:MAG: TetR/AcrR family transcriptional regulator [Actinobacteria bacterium]|nr:TetR/AcrR family transcriptional regulator [Actinomycetota bacterium]
MQGGVKSGSLTYRQQQAEATKVRIAESARELFATDGYGATSMEAIATQAGVATRTVYAAFGAKREILNLICERWLEQADARGLAQDVLARADAISRLRGAAHWLTVLYSTDFDVARILDSAVDEDAETRALLQGKLRGRNHVMDQLITSARDELSIPLADARAIFRALGATGVYGELVQTAGWTPQRFETWLGNALVTELTT